MRRIKVNKFLILIVFFAIGVLSMGASSWLIINEQSGSPSFNNVTYISHNVSIKNALSAETAIYETDTLTVTAGIPGVFCYGAEQTELATITESNIGKDIRITAPSNLTGSATTIPVDVRFIPDEEYLEKNKYELTDANKDRITTKVYIKAVAYIKNGSNYTNINNAVDIANNGTNKNIYIIVGVTLDVTQSITLTSSTKLYVPYEGETTKAFITPDKNTVNAVKTTINFKNGADLIIENGATFEIGAQMGTKGVVGLYCKVNLDKKSSITVNGTLNAYGYVSEINSVKGNATTTLVYDNSTDAERCISVSSTGNINTTFQTNDISSGSTLKGKVDANICPTYNYQFPALQTYTVIQTGGIVSAYAYVKISTVESDAQVGIIYPATLSDEKSMFYQVDGTIAIEWCSDSKTIIYVNGDVNVGKIYINASGYEIDSDKMFIPISSRFSIFIDGILNTNSKRIKFLPGSHVQVLAGGTFNINSPTSTQSQVAIYPVSAMTGLGITGYSNDAIFINDGTINIDSTSKFGGYVQTTKTDGSAIVNLSSVSDESNLSVSDVEWVNGVAEGIAEVPLTGPFYDSANEENGFITDSSFTYGEEILSYEGLACWVGALNTLVDIKLTVLKTGVRTESFSYTVYTNTTNSDSGQEVQISTNTTTRTQDFQLTSGMYIKLVDTISVSITLNGSSYTSGTWVEVTGPLIFEITPIEAFVVTCYHTNGGSGAGDIVRSITYGPNSSNMTYKEERRDGGKVTATIPKNWVFKVSDNARVSGKSTVTKTTYDENGTATTTEIATANSKLAWKDSTIYQADGDYMFVSDDVTCLVEGTLITLADGSQKKVEDLVVGDMVLIFNHVTGKLEVMPIIFNNHSDQEARLYDVLHLNFANGSEVKIVASHGFFDMTLMKYVYITNENYADYIGHEFYYIGTDGVAQSVVLESAFIKQEVTRIFCPVSYFHMNSFANGFLNTPNIPGNITGLVNYFEYGEGLKYDEEQMQADIEKYGLYTYEDFKDYISYEAYLSSPAVYLKVSVGKGMMTFEDILDVINYLLEGSLIS